jgi:hypothetical protein
MSDDRRWIFIVLLVAAMIGWKMLLRRFGFRRKDKE